MPRYFITSGVRIKRRARIKLAAEERSELSQAGRVVLHRPIEWPVEGRIPDFDRGYVDAGGTDIWGPGPYLKVPNTGVRDGEFETINRVFCPWGYPPDTLRISWSKRYARLVHLDIARAGNGREWLIALEQVEPAPSDAPAGVRTPTI